MDNTIKILLTISLEGGVLVRQNNIEFIKSEYRLTQHVNKVPKQCVQRIKISNEAYEQFISSECPSFYSNFMWKKLSPKQKLEVHLSTIAKDLNGLSFTYEILLD